MIAASVTPYVKFKLTSADGNTTYDYTSRVLSIEHHEVAYNDYATVVLQNNDRVVASDLRGYWVQIAYGFITGNNVADSEGAESAGNGDTAEYSYTARLWVTSQQEYSSPGNVKVILELEGMWVALKNNKRISVAGATAESFYLKEYDGSTSTVFAIISAMLVEAGFTLDAIGDQSDGIIDVLMPVFYINGGDVKSSFDQYDVIIYNLLTFTKCYLRAKSGLAFKVVYPQAGDAVAKTFYSDQQPYYYEYLERKKALIPNHIYVMWGDTGVGGPAAWADWDFAPSTLGEASDAGEIAKYRECIDVVVAGDLTTEAAADARAAAILSRAKAELLSGRMVVRHDCSIELYDRVAADDNRNSSWVSPTGFVDGDSNWNDEANAYDGNTATLAYSPMVRNNIGNYLELTHSAIYCDKIRLWATISATSTGTKFIFIDVYYSGGWHNIYGGTLTGGQWVEYSLGGKYNVTAIRAKFQYLDGSLTGQARIYEAAFYGGPSYPSDSLTRVSGLVHRCVRGKGANGIDRYSLEMILGDTRTDWGELKAEMSSGTTPTLPVLSVLPSLPPAPPLVWNPPVPAQTPTSSDPTVIQVDRNVTVPFTEEDRTNLINQTFPNRPVPLDTSVPLQPLTSPAPAPPLVWNPTQQTQNIAALQAQINTLRIRGRGGRTGGHEIIEE